MVDTLSPYWTYSVEGFKPSQIVGEELIIWKNGCCVFVYDEQEILEAQVFTTERAWEPVFFEKIFLNQAMGQNNQKLKRVWIADERSLIIPEKLFIGEASKLWLKRLHHIGVDDEIFANAIPEIGAHIVYAYDATIAALMKKYFNHLEVLSLSRFSLSNLKQFDSTESVASLILLQHTALLSVTNSGKLLAHQTFEFETVENVVYKIALIAEKNDFDPMMVHFNVTGIIDAVEEFALDLRSYVKQVDIMTGNNGPILELLKQIKACV
jgi:hypothetical protein